jgi:SAM-dependent methyltransferase
MEDEPTPVIWAYRLFLDREPENNQVVGNKAGRLTTSQELRREFMQSEEFRQKNPWLNQPALAGDEPGMVIEDVHSKADLQTLFQHTQDVWQHLGETEPHWSVLSSKSFLQENIHRSKEAFFDSGQYDLARLFHALERNGIDSSSFKSCLEYGCGLGRVTRWLATRFEAVVGCDISRSHLQGAESYLAGKGVRNVTLQHIQQISDLANLPKVDVIFSFIVLQHNPPPVISLIIRAFIRALRPGGVALFQVPTYRFGYRFVLQEYLSQDDTRREMEMHVLAQKQIFEIIEQEGGRSIQVLEDVFAGCGAKEVSNTFLVQKRNG